MTNQFDYWNQIANAYEEEGGPAETPRDIVAWAMTTGRWRPQQEDVIQLGIVEATAALDTNDAEHAIESRFLTQGMLWTEDDED